MDKKTANNIMVGVFVALGFIGFTFLVFSLGGTRSFFSSTFPLYAKYTHVRGLHSGSQVSLSGLRIGVIRSINVSDTGDKSFVVEMDIEQGVSQYIRRDSLAYIRTQGLLGDKYVELTIGTLDQPPLEPGSYVQTREELDLMTRGGSVLDGIAKQFAEGGKIDTLMANVNTLVINLNKMASGTNKKGLLNEMIYGDSGEKLGHSLDHLEKILLKIETGRGTLGAFVNDPTVYEDVKYLLGGAKRSSVLKYFLREFVESGAKTKGAPPKDSK